MASDGTTVQSCEGPNEICVCATRSCAKVDLDSYLAMAGAGGAVGEEHCASGYRYLDSPFAEPDVAGECVPQGLIDMGILDKEDSSDAVCEDVRPARTTTFEDVLGSGMGGVSSEDDLMTSTDSSTDSNGGAGGATGND